MKKGGGLSSVLFLALLFSPFTCIPDATAQAKKDYSIDGAKLLFSRVTPWAQAYAKQSDCTPTIMGSKTGHGYRGWLSGEVDVVAASRHLTDSEKEQALKNGMDTQFIQVGTVPLAVMVNEKNPVNDLSLERLRKIFTGEITNWKEVDGLDQAIIVTTRPVPVTGTGLLFQKNILKGAPYAKGHMVMPLFSTTAKIVRSKLGAIGYIPTTSPSYGSRGIKAIGVKKDADTAAARPEEGPVKQTVFPVTIPFLLVWDAKSPKADCLRGFAEFAAAQVK